MGPGFGMSGSESVAGADWIAIQRSGLTRAPTRRGGYWYFFGQMGGSCLGIRLAPPAALFRCRISSIRLDWLLQSGPQRPQLAQLGQSHDSLEHACVATSQVISPFSNHGVKIVVLTRSVNLHTP